MSEQEDYPAALSAIVGQLVSGNRAGAERDMAGIAYAKRPISRRPAIRRPLMISVFRRDCWTCRYCDRRTIFYPVMPLLGVIFPEQFPYHTNWKAGQTHPAVAACSAIVDHVEPGSLRGTWLEESNLATACWPCNARKGDLTLDQLGWRLMPVEKSPWDGLSGSYRQLWEVAGRPANDAHPQWLRALADAPGAG
jgi:5-methylcytosine-specific restriction endonuclease McrA